MEQRALLQWSHGTKSKLLTPSWLSGDSLRALSGAEVTNGNVKFSFPLKLSGQAVRYHYADFEHCKMVG